MKIFYTKNKLTKITNNQKSIGFIPTMGAIHKGHVSLIKKSINQCNKTIVSIYVNKPQFNKRSDYKKYPRLITKDINILKKLKVDYLFIPKKKEIYPNGVNNPVRNFGRHNNCSAHPAAHHWLDGPHYESESHQS